MKALSNALEVALWAGDVGQLDRLAPCQCCCADHTHEGCPARQWHGCRGQDSMTRADHESWARHYAQNHGMCAERFETGECSCCRPTDFR